MKRASVLFSIILAIFAFTSIAIVNADNFAVGSKTESFSLPDTSGTVQTLDGLKGANGSVVVFLSAQCPVVKLYNDRINQIAADYQAKGISFIGINSNHTESLDWVKSHAAENYKFPVLIDKGNVLADKYGANTTPEIFFFDKNNVLLYRGAVDNDRSGKTVTEPYLKNAFDASLAGKPIEKNTTNAVGCRIKRLEAKQ
jgi:peroxiredoxin